MTSNVNTNQGIDYVSQLKRKRVPFSIRIIQLYIKFLAMFSKSKAADFVVKLFLTPRVKPLNDRQLEWYNKGKSEFISINDKEVFVWSSGENPSVLLIHGWGSSSYRLHYMIDYFIDRKMDVVTFDYPSHGLSSGKMTNLLEVEKTVNHLLQKFQTVNTVIGYSFGGLALLRPVQQNQQIETFISLAAPKILETLTSTFFNMFDVPDPVITHFFLKMEKKVDMPKEEWASIVHERFSEVRILQIHDQDDNVVPINDADIFKELYPHMEYIKTEGHGHSGILKSAENFNLIYNFIQRK